MMPADLRIALKEWAVLCADLARGDRIALARKGGIADSPAGFAVEQAEFWLLPTRFHQQADELAEEVRPLLSTVAAPPPGRIRIALRARVTDAYRIEHESDLPRLKGLHGLAESTVRERFHYRRPGLTVLGLQVSLLSQPQELDDLPAYAGCHSWVELATPLSADSLRPALSAAEFAARRRNLQSALAGLPHADVPPEAGGG